MSESLGLYISVPFCRAKCTYCNFASGVFPAADHARYVDRVCAEIDGAAACAEQRGCVLPRQLGSMYLGGGTPSMLGADRLRQIFSAARASFLIASDAEITAECAPGQIAAEFLQAMVEVGVTRVSLGVQSLVDKESAATGRLHTRATVAEDVRRLHAAGIAVNIDLIAGLPGQTRTSWDESVTALRALEVEHASLYMLEVDEDSRLGRELIAGGRRYGADLTPGDDTVAAMYEAGCEQLEQSGMRQYEISNFARPGAESRHNLRYWRREPYLGIGLDAHSMLRGRDGGAVRFGNANELDAYLAGEPGEPPERLSRAEEIEEAWFLGLRLVEGVQLDQLREELGPAAACEEVIDELTSEGLLQSDAQRVRLTQRGRMFSNDVFARFLGVASEEACGVPG